ncbi:MAG: cytochrome c biogenesis protein ResB [Opitutales bacterium]
MKIVLKALKTVFRALGSLRLTTIILAVSVVLVFLGTLDQANWGIHHTQQKYFESWFVKSPVVSLVALVIVQDYPEHLEWLYIWLPGGFLLGTLLVINLVCAHFRYFKPGWHRIGIAMTHGGLVLLIIAGFLVSLLQKEYRMILDEGGGPVWHLSAFRGYELALINETDPTRDTQYVLPADQLASGATLPIGESGLQVEVLGLAANAALASRQGLLNSLHEQIDLGRLEETSEAAAQKMVAALEDPGVRFVNRLGDAVGRLGPNELRGAGREHDLAIHGLKLTFAHDETNVASAVVRLRDGEQSLGGWVLSPSLTDNDRIAPQRFEHDGRVYRIELRFPRTYLPFSLALDDFIHRRHPGTDIPAEFASELRLDNPQTQEARPVRIAMNEPLRYGGYTFYQASFANEDRTSMLQVVHNPSWLLPYFSVGIVGLGLVVHFMIGLYRFLTRQEKKRARAQAPPATPVPALEEAEASASRKPEPATL